MARSDTDDWDNNRWEMATLPTKIRNIFSVSVLNICLQIRRIELQTVNVKVLTTASWAKVPTGYCDNNRQPAALWPYLAMFRLILKFTLMKKYLHVPLSVNDRPMRGSPSCGSWRCRSQSSPTATGVYFTSSDVTTKK